MKCPFCSKSDSSVLESRDSEDETVIRRRRECNNCRKRFTTYERIERPQLTVVKRNRTREQFEVEKLRKGVMRAFEKRNVVVETIENLIDQVERELLRKSKAEVTARQIGGAVLRRLRTIDKVAYIRFASVYLDFKDIDDFKEIIDKVEE